MLLDVLIIYFIQMFFACCLNSLTKAAFIQEDENAIWYFIKMTFLPYSIADAIRRSADDREIKMDM